MDKTQLIELLALQLDVKPNAIRQWRMRKTVPYKWRLPILKAAKGRLTEEAFESFGQ
jgi:hypothetical protein